MIMKVLIIEDEAISFRRLKRMIHGLRPDMEIDGPLTTTSEVISRLSEHSGYDLIFSDIRLRGQEVFSAFQTVMPECMVIFTTAYDEYALKAFKSNGVDYLLKPIDNESLSAAIKKAESIAGKNVSSKSNIDAAIGELRSYRERILIWKGAMRSTFFISVLQNIQICLTKCLNLSTKCSNPCKINKILIIA